MLEEKPPEPQENPNNINQGEISQQLPNINNNMDINNNANFQINNNTDTEKANNRELKTFFDNNHILSSFLLDFSTKEKNKKLDELIYDLKNYKELNEKAKIKTGFKHSLYENLEKNLIELSFLTNNEIRKARMHKLYLWYKNKTETFEDLKRIQEKSYKEQDEIDDLDVLKQKEEEKKANAQEEDIIALQNKTLEDFYKHRNKDMLFKDMLDDYKRKHITNPYAMNQTEGKDKELLTSENDKKMYKTLSVTSFRNMSNTGEISTFYSTKNGQNPFTLKKDLTKTQPLFHKVEGGALEKTFYSVYNKDNNNHNYFPPLNRETKFSYSFNRPVYNYYSVYAENKILQSKMKNLAEKRSREEIDDKMDIYGQNKAKYKENEITKYELRDIVNMYSNMNNFKSPLLEKYKYKTTKDKKDNGENKITFGIQKIASEKIEDKSKNGLLIGKKERLFDINRNMKRSQSSVIVENNPLNEKKKMEINKVKNIDINSKSILEKSKEEIKLIKLKLKQPKDRIKSRLMKYQENSSKIPNDAIPNLFFKNSLFRDKMLYNNICGVNFKKEGKIKEVDTGEDSESEYHNFYMSAYDFGNLRKIETFKNIKSKGNYRNRIKKPINENINKTFNLNKENYLNFRKTMSSWKKNDFEKLCNKIMKNKDNKETTSKKSSNINDENRALYNKRKINLNLKRQTSLFSAMLNPIEDSCYPQYFLPRSGSMLMIRKGQSVKKGKKGKKKK